MAKNIVFLVHGLGVHGAGWSKRKGGPVETLTNAAKPYIASAGGLTDTVEFVEIRYDDIFDKILSRWSELATSLQGKLPEAVPAEIVKVTDALAKANDPDDWFAAQGMDLFFYTGFRLVRRLVQLRVVTTMMNAIARQREEAARELRCVVVAHSLGTAVAHDAISLMCDPKSAWLGDIDRAVQAVSDQTGGGHSRDVIQRAVDRFGPNPFAPHVFKLDAIYMVSNTSLLLCPDALQTVVRPAFGGDPPGNCCKRYINVNHVLDLIGRARLFRSAAAWPNAAAQGTARDLNPEHLHFKDIHSLEHYLIHPALHADILFAATDAFGMPEFRKALARLDTGDFPARAGPFADEALLAKFRAKLQEASTKNGENLAALLGTLAGMRTEIRELFASSEEDDESEDDAEGQQHA